MMRTPIPFKVSLVMKASEEATMHRFQGAYDFDQISDTLQQIAVSTYPNRMEGWHVGFDYTDPEGDRVRVASELEWRECVQLYAEANPGATKPLRLNAFRTHKPRKPMPAAIANLMEHTAHTPILRSTTPLPVLNAENLDRHVRFAAGTAAGDGETTSVRHNSRMSSPLTPPLSASHLDANPMHPPLESQPDLISIKSAGSTGQRDDSTRRGNTRTLSFSQEGSRSVEPETVDLDGDDNEADSYSESFIDVDEPEGIEDVPRKVEAPARPELAVKTAAPVPPPPAATAAPQPVIDDELAAAIEASIAESGRSATADGKNSTTCPPSAESGHSYRPWNNANDNSYVLVEMFPDVPRKTIKGMLKHHRNNVHEVMELLLRGKRN